MVKQLQDSWCVSLQQRCYALDALLRAQPTLVRCTLQLDGFGNEVRMDAELSFMDRWIETVIAHCVRPYVQPAAITALPQRVAARGSSTAPASRAAHGGVCASSIDGYPSFFFQLCSTGSGVGCGHLEHWQGDASALGGGAERWAYSKHAPRQQVLGTSVLLLLCDGVHGT
ncbi:hypothetical protein Q4I30_005940 [Leishmania utingensis]|uniref:Uncharacterized protein n=1 Tax=Leishmania utingensis TaxID=653362 RepID=A0AAW3A6N7_9TRYP